MASLLVLDSDATAREALAQALRLRGYRVRSAPAAPASTSELASPVPEADLIVLGLADAEQAEAAASVLDGAPIIVCASSGAAVDALGDADVVAWFPKPTDVAKLLDFIEGYVHGRRFRVWPG